MDERELVAENSAGYADARSGHTIAYAIILNDFGAIIEFDDVLGVLAADEARITIVLYENN